MHLVLVALVLCACGGANPVVVENRGGVASTSCNLPTRVEFEARRYAMLDADDKDYEVWTPWRMGLQISESDVAKANSQPHPSQTRVKGTLALVGDYTMTFDFEGRYHRDRCALDLRTDSHESLGITIDLRAHTGQVRSIDDEWVLGPPFPSKRP